MANSQFNVTARFEGCYYSSGQCYEVKGVPTKDGKTKMEAFLSFKDEDGTWRKTKRTIWATGKKDAESQLKAYQNEMEQARITANAPEEHEQRVKPLTVSDCVHDFMDTQTIKTKKNPTGIARATYDNYTYSLKHVESGFDGMQLDELTPKVVDTWLKTMSDLGKSGSTCKKAYWLLKAACDYAVENGDMDSELYRTCFPKKRKGVGAPKQAEPDPNPLDAHSLDILNMLLDHRDGADAFTTSIEIALLTGMREAEICGLRWKDVDMAGNAQYPTGYIHVCNVLSRAGSTYIEKEPKTKAGNRYIPLNNDLRDLLNRRNKFQSDELESCGLNKDALSGLYVTGDVRGKWFNPTVLSRRWRGLADGANLKGTKGRKVVFHDLRHTFATQAIHAKVDIEVVSKLLGHKDVSVTLNIYGDAMPEAKTSGMEALNGILRASKKEG